MPQLPKKNSLDYNPDATILASKKITAIALERMKNPVEDADQSTLSTLQAQKQLSDSFDRLDEMAGNYSNLVTRLSGLLGKQQFKTKKAIESRLEGRGRGRKLTKRMKGGAEEGEVGSSVSSASTEYRRRLQADRDRFRDFYNDDDRNSTATPSSSGFPIHPDDGISEISFDDESSSSIPMPRAYFDFGGDDSGELRSGDLRFVETLPENIKIPETINFNSLIFPIIQLTRKMNILINSRIKPAIQSLSQQQITKLTEIYKMVRHSYNDVIFPATRKERRMPKPYPFLIAQEPTYPEMRRFLDIEEGIIFQNQFGDEILSVWNEERKNLLLNLTVIINSWRQNTPTGQQAEFSEDVNRSFQNTATRLGKKAELVAKYPEVPEGFDYERDIVGDLESFGAGRKPRGRPRKTGSMTLIGNGRNFYGEQVNTSADIPTIWSGAMRNCPTKYLL